MFWLRSNQLDPATDHPVIGASTVCRSGPVSTPSTVSGILSQQSLPLTPESLSCGVPRCSDQLAFCAWQGHTYFLGTGGTALEFSGFHGALRRIESGYRAVCVGHSDSLWPST